MTQDMNPQRVIMWLGIELAEKRAEIATLKEELHGLRGLLQRMSPLEDPQARESENGHAHAHSGPPTSGDVDEGI